MRCVGWKKEEYPTANKECPVSKVARVATSFFDREICEMRERRLGLWVHF
jgi:hypothetical protein